jgi:hypothetical protein
MIVVSLFVRASNHAYPGQRVKPALKLFAHPPITHVDPATHGAAIP